MSGSDVPKPSNGDQGKPSGDSRPRQADLFRTPNEGKRQETPSQEAKAKVRRGKTGGDTRYQQPRLFPDSPPDTKQQEIAPEADQVRKAPETKSSGEPKAVRLDKVIPLDNFPPEVRAQMEDELKLRDAWHQVKKVVGEANRRYGIYASEYEQMTWGSMVYNSDLKHDVIFLAEAMEKKLEEAFQSVGRPDYWNLLRKDGYFQDGHFQKALEGISKEAFVEEKAASRRRGEIAADYYVGTLLKAERGLQSVEKIFPPDSDNSSRPREVDQAWELVLQVADADGGKRYIVVEAKGADHSLIDKEVAGGQRALQDTPENLEQTIRDMVENKGKTPREALKREVGEKLQSAFLDSRLEYILVEAPTVQRSNRDVLTDIRVQHIPLS